VNTVPLVIDAHVHAYPREVAEDPEAWGLGHGEPGWTACVAPKGRRSIQGWADADRMVADMDTAGVAASVLLGWYWERQETCELQNAWYATWIGRHPGRLAGFATVQPRAGKRAVDAFKEALDRGLCGLGEILPQAQGFSLDDPWWRRIVEVAVARKVPVTLHATDPEAGAAAGPATPLKAYLDLAREYPEGAFILAHWGGGLAFRPMPAEWGALPANLYFDTAASPLMYGGDVFQRAVDLVGTGRILYGSDYPLLLYPRESREPGFGRFLSEIASSGVTGDGLSQILGGNARRLILPALAPAQKPL
jgi:predicted TIM-barrel fold metal-dependent hydrolase